MKTGRKKLPLHPGNSRNKSFRSGGFSINSQKKLRYETADLSTIPRTGASGEHGWHLRTFKKTLPNGQRIYVYTTEDRKHGLTMMILGIVMLVVWSFWGY